MAKPRRVLQRTQTDNSLSVLREAGMLEGVAIAALVANVRGLADAVDAEPLSAPLWREFRQAWQELRREARLTMRFDGRDDDDAIDPIEQLLADIEAAEVGGGSDVRDPSEG